MRDKSNQPREEIISAYVKRLRGALNPSDSSAQESALRKIVEDLMKEDALVIAGVKGQWLAIGDIWHAFQPMLSQAEKQAKEKETAQDHTQKWEEEDRGNPWGWKIGGNH